MAATPFQVRKESPSTVMIAQHHVSQEAMHALQNYPREKHNHPNQDNKLNLSTTSKMHHVSPPRRRYPTLITFLNGQPIPHPLRLPPLQSSIRKPRQRACLPSLRPQPAIMTDVTPADSCREGDSRKFVQGKHSKTLKSTFDTRKRFCRWLSEEDRVLVNAYRKYGNDWRTIAKLLPGRSPLAVRKRFHGKIRDQFEFTVDDKNFSTRT